MAKMNTTLKYGILLIIILVLGVAIYLVSTQKTTSVELPENYLSIGEMGIIKTLTIQGLDQKVVLENRGSEWYIIEPLTYKANPQNTEKLRTQLNNALVLGFVSDKLTARANYDVGYSDGIGIIVEYVRYDGELSEDESITDVVPPPDAEIQTLAFIVGKKAEGGNEYFIRKFDPNLEDEQDIGEDAIYRVKSENDFANVFKDTLDYWMDKTIVALDQNRLITINASWTSENGASLSENLELKRAEGRWQVLNDAEEWIDADETKLSPILSKLEDFKCSSFVLEEDSEQYTFTETPAFILSYQREIDPNPTELAFYQDPENESQYYLRLNEGAPIMKVYSSNLNVFKKDAEELKAVEPPPSTETEDQVGTPLNPENLEIPLDMNNP